MRVYNPSEIADKSGAVEFTTPVTQWIETLLDETPKAVLVALPMQYFGTLALCQAKTFRVQF